MAGTLTLVAVLITVAHGRFVSRLLSGDEAKTVLAVRSDEARIAELERDIALEPPLKIETAELARLRAYKELVDLRVFPWRRFLAELEEILSGDVRLTKISPGAPKGGQGMIIELSGEARNKNAAFSLAEDLDASPMFSNAVLKSLVEEDDRTEFDLELVFDPPPTSMPAGKTP